MKTNQKKMIQPLKNPVLRFTPTAWAKLLLLRDAGESEIGGFGVAAADDLLLVEDIQLVSQTASWAHVEFNDLAVADFFDDQVDADRRPQQFARIWVHTHPGNSAQPSQTDEWTFARVFGGSDWALMFILARGGQTYARLRYNVGPGADVLIFVEIDYGRPFQGTDAAAWQQEYAERVHVELAEPLVSEIRRSPHIDWPKESAADAGRSSDEECQTPDEWGQPPAAWYDDWYEYSHPDQQLREAEYGYVRDY